MAMNPYLQMLPPHMMGGPPRPLFPAVATSVGNQPKPTFPAYSNATISAPPTTNLGASSSSTSSSTTNTNSTATNQEPPKPSTVPATGTASKIMHPAEDVSLEEIRARRPQYKVNKVVTVSSPQSSAASASSSSTPTSIASVNSQVNKFNEAKMVAAQEVFAQHVNMNFLTMLIFDYFLFACLSFSFFGILDYWNPFILISIF
jgi:hypothetical protein